MGSSILSINSNISSLRAQRQLGAATTALSSSFEKLSSGLRINKASDDAAGLAVASSLKADTRIYSQGVRNLNDGVSALNIADGALANLSSIVIRMQELAEQSANGAAGWKQRKSLDAEAQALAKEYFRISRTTDFNGLKLFDGSIQGLSLQAGYGSNGSILSSLGGALGTGTFGAATSYRMGSDSVVQAISLSDLNGDGNLDAAAAVYDYATISLGKGDGTFGAAITYDTELGDGSFALSVSDLNRDGVLDLVTAGGGNGYAARATVRLGNGDGTFRAANRYLTESGVFSTSFALSTSDINGDGILDLATAGTDGSAGYATIRLGNGDGTFKKSLSYATENSPYALSISDIDRDGVLDLVTAGDDPTSSGCATIRLGNGDGTFRAARSYQTESGTVDGASSDLSLSDVNRDGILDLVTAGNSDTSGYATIRLGKGDGTFNASLSYQTDSGGCAALSMSDINGDEMLDIVTAGGTTATFRLGNGDGTFRTPLSCSTAPGGSTTALSLSDVNGDGVLDFAIGGYGVDGIVSYISVHLANTRDGISPILPFSLKTQAEALQALPVFKRTLEGLSVQRGEIGAFQSRLSCALNTLGSTALQYRGAQSRVEEIDVASESANLVRQQILQQAASSVLAQANQAPSLALMLLKA